MESFHPQVILVPTDFSELATFALKYAQGLAACSGARLLVVYADPFLPPPHFTALQMDAVVESLRHSKEAARSFLSRYVDDQAVAGVAMESLLVEDLPVPGIINAAEARNADLIVMGTHGRSGISRVMLGSVTERVLRETGRPVLAVRQKRGSAAPSLPASIKNILCPVNFTAISRQVILRAAAVAGCFGAALTVLHIIEAHLSQTVAEAEEGRLSNWIPAEVRQRCALKEVVLKGNAAEHILSLAGSSGSDMIVVGAQHKRFFDSTVLGTTTIRVLRHAPCPVLTIAQR